MPRVATCHSGAKRALAVTESRLLRAQRQVNDLPAPVIPAVNEPLPGQARRSI